MSNVSDLRRAVIAAYNDTDSRQLLAVANALTGQISQVQATLGALREASAVLARYEAAASAIAGTFRGSNHYSAKRAVQEMQRAASQAQSVRLALQQVEDAMEVLTTIGSGAAMAAGHRIASAKSADAYLRAVG